MDLQILPELNYKKGPYYIDLKDLDLKNFKPDKFILHGPVDYPRWHREMTAYLKRKEKLGFVNGTFKAPPNHEKKEYEAWKKCNGLVLKWILKSVSPHIAKTIKDSKISDAAFAWIKLKKHSPEKLLVISNILRKIHKSEQGGLGVKEFLDKIKSRYNSLDALRQPPKCSCGALDKLKKQREDEILGVFLNGLNSDYHKTRTLILQNETLLSPQKACDFIVQVHSLNVRQHR